MNVGYQKRFEKGEGKRDGTGGIIGRYNLA